MDSSKLTPGLASRLRSARAGELVDVVVELTPSSTASARIQPGSRAERIAVLKDTFGEDVQPVTTVIGAVGGEVLGTAWINRTVRGRVPIEGVDQLSEVDAVRLLDLPHSIEPDASSHR
jgi:hypothetical protein